MHLFLAKPPFEFSQFSIFFLILVSFFLVCLIFPHFLSFIHPPSLGAVEFFNFCLNFFLFLVRAGDFLALRGGHWLGREKVHLLVNLCILRLTCFNIGLSLHDSIMTQIGQGMTVAFTCSKLIAVFPRWRGATKIIYHQSILFLLMQGKYTPSFEFAGFNQSIFLPNPRFPILDKPGFKLYHYIKLYHYWNAWVPFLDPHSLLLASELVLYCPIK